MSRLGAVVVAPGMSVATLTEQLRQRVDPVFLPRPLLLVEQLPRNATGKLPQQALQGLPTSIAPRNESLMKMQSAIRISPDHPSFAGHFPRISGLPGAILLDEMLQGPRESARDRDQAWQIASAKFLGAVRPSDPGLNTTPRCPD